MMDGPSTRWAVRYLIRCLGRAAVFSVLLTSCTRIIVLPPAETPVPARPAPVPDIERPTPAPDPEQPIPTAFAEVRGVWVVRTSLDSPEEVRETVRRAWEAGFNTLLVQVRGRGDAFYRSSIEPRAERLSGQPTSFDPLDLMIREGHSRGMAVHAWLVSHLVWGLGTLPADPGHLVRLHPDWLAVPRSLAAELDGVDPFRASYLNRLHDWTVAQDGRFEGLYVNPAIPAVRARLADVAEDIARRYPVDGIHLDYIRYAAPEYDYSRASLEAFRGWMGSRVPQGASSAINSRLRGGEVLAWVTEYPSEFGDFRREQVTLAVEEVRNAVRRARPSVTLSAAVFADPIDARNGRFQAWPEWLASGLIDVVQPMAYTSRDDLFADLMEAAKRADPSGRRVWPGLGIYQDSFDGAIRKLGMVRESGFAGAVLFSWDWALHEAPDVRGTTWLDAFSRQAFRRGR